MTQTKTKAKERLLNILAFSLPYYLMDMILKIMASGTGTYPGYYYSSIIYTVLWTTFFYYIIINTREKIGKTLYWVFFVLSYLLFITNIVYYHLTNFFFSFTLIEMTGEGTAYIFDAIKNTPIIYYILIPAVLGLEILTYKKFEFTRKPKCKYGWAICILCFCAVHLVSPLMFGPTKTALRWNSFNKPRSVYNSFSDYNKCMKLTGLYEYSTRNFYITFLKPAEKIPPQDMEFLDSQYKPGEPSLQDNYTGVFKGKNVIFLQLEGIDDWLLTKESMPNLYGLMKKSINFTNHYSIYSGGGSTFNSEFAVNTGFTTPISYNQNVYTLNNNIFPYTLPKLFKKQGYAVNAFHMNSGDFYSRNINYKSWGYDNYFGLIDMADYSDNSYELDRELILNKTFYKEIFRKDQKFVDYIITYSPHTPFTTVKGVGKTLAEEKYGKGNVPDLSEEETAKLMVGETDKMIGLLMQGLKDNGLYENTVIVAFADHYLYTINDKSVLYKNNKASDNLINHTPFFIWADGVKPVEISDVTMQMNILPTVLNLMGIQYDSNHFLFKNALSEGYRGFAFFSDYSWYDGNVYVENGEIKNQGETSEKELAAKNQFIHDIIRKNDLTLKTNYFASN